MKAFSFLAIACALTQSTSAFAYTKEEFRNAVGVLDEQVEKLVSLSPQSCPSEHKKLNSVKDLRISLFYGYEDYEESTADSVHAAAMAHMLKRPCPKNFQACGFKQHSKTANRVVLQKKIGERFFTVSIYHTSVSTSDADNKDPNKHAFKQAARSHAVREQFHRALSEEDIVFYSGHSRHGGGLGFNSQNLPQDVMNFIFRLPVASMANALREKPSHLKLFGLFACETQKHYRNVVEQANPNANLIVSHEDIGSEEGEQQSIGALNAIFMNKCNAEFQESLISTIEPEHNVLEYVRRPE